jgi:biotin operon repressor
MNHKKGWHMSGKELRNYELLTEFQNRKISRAQVAALLQISERAVSMKAKKLREQGIQGVFHGNQGKTPANKTPSELKEKVLNLLREKYFDFNLTHFLEKLKEVEGINISYSVLYNLCKNSTLMKRPKKRRAKIRTMRERSTNEGFMLQLDGSHHAWNGEDKWVLISMIDDATSKIPWAEFFNTEDTLNCMTVLQRVIERFGIPEFIYTDKAGWLGGTAKREGFSQFLRACDTLGIKVIFANSPQAKGRIERSWNTIQDRLIPELRLKNIYTIPAANNYLLEEFLPNYWNVKNTVEAKVSQVKYRKINELYDLKEIFCLKQTRKVNGDHTIKLENSTYQLLPNGHFSMKGREVEIRTYPDMKTKAFFADKEVKMKLIENAPTQKPLRVNGIAGIKPKKAKEFFQDAQNKTLQKAS